MSSLGDSATELLWTLCNAVQENYIVVISILLIIVLGFLLPDISHKVQVRSDVKAMKKVLDLVTVS